MAFDQPTRNRLARFVGEARALLTEEFTRQLQHEYGLDPARGEVTELARLTQLDDARRETARILRETLAHYLAGQPTPTAKACQEALDRLVREQAFTVLNRLCALRMAEARGLLIESIAKGYQSRGFQLYARLAGPALGETGEAYRAYLFSLFDEFGVDLAVLFDRFSPQGRLFPRASTLLQLLAAINHPDLEPLWGEDETIGWIYQYFNSKEERKAMRDASQAPRNSRELAVRNQFFTPRYVVEFLTDNTLGRIWYEMTQGRTSLVDSCRYLVRRPHEIFLNEGEEAPTDKVTGFDVSSAERGQGDQDLTQQELLRQPVYIPFRQIKDPRTILMLDPACGSMHFGLYSFDLYERIYEEAWALEGELGAHAFERPAAMAPLRERYRDKVSFLRDVPRLIIEHNIHGIDIDPRAVQIAGLSLWLRAQRSWQTQGLKPHERPTIRKSNIVCAEPMPGDKALLEEFLQGLRDDRLEVLIRRVLSVPENQSVRATPTMADALCDLVRTVWDEMKLAGEAGSLLKIEEALTGAITKGRAEWEEKMPLFRVETFRMTEEKPKVNYVKVVPGDGVDFWTRSEALVLAALEEYTGQANQGDSYQRRLFAEDTAQGFAFIDLCRKHYDIVLMNPPFGEPVKTTDIYLDKHFQLSKHDLATTMVSRWLVTSPRFLGAITTRTPLFNSSSHLWRKESLLSNNALFACLDLGGGVLDAMVETSAYVINSVGSNEAKIFVRLTTSSTEQKPSEAHTCLTNLKYGTTSHNLFLRNLREFESLPNVPLAYWLPVSLAHCFSSYSSLKNNGAEAWVGLQTSSDERFLRLWWEIPTGSSWKPFAKGGDASPYFADIHLTVNWAGNGKEMKAFHDHLNFIGKSTPGNGPRREFPFYFMKGLTWVYRTDRFHVQPLPAGCITSTRGPGIYSERRLPFLLGYLNSAIADVLVKVLLGKHIQPQFDIDDVNSIPTPHTNELELEKLGLRAWAIRNNLARTLEESRGFYLGVLYTDKFESSLQQQYSSAMDNMERAIKELSFIQINIDHAAARLLSVPNEDFLTLQEMLFEWSDFGILSESKTGYVHRCISYILGCTFGRWNVHFVSTKKMMVPDSLDPFAPLPVCPPGMLQNAQSLPAIPADVPSDYPLRISWLGILLDDSGHPEDIEVRVRDVLRIIWPDYSEAIEQEACEILDAASLRDYFANPNGFFDNHLKRYSKSRRAAPIYWPLSTPSGSYTLWLYYHRLTDQTLYSCVNDFVEPKLAQVNDDVDTLRRRTNRSRQEEKDLDQLSELALELAAFRDELLRIARFWQPNLNDGVQITAAPLWRLFQHRGWQKRLKETWAALEAGDYDWAHLAYSMWPERVRAKCKTDKSLAIAHDLEELYVEPVKPVKAKKGGRKAKVEAETMGLFEGDTTAD